MKTIAVKVDVSTGASMTEDLGDLSWDEAKIAMRNVVAELKFYRKKPMKPRAVRSGGLRFILIGFREG